VFNKLPDKTHLMFSVDSP